MKDLYVSLLIFNNILLLKIENIINNFQLWHIIYVGVDLFIMKLNTVWIAKP